MSRLWFAIYSAIATLLVPVGLVHLWLRSRRQPEYLEHVPERLGRYGITPARPVIWIHAVSVGETRAAQPLVHALAEHHPGYDILVTHTTPTGRATGTQLFGESVLQAYLPYDAPFLVTRFFGRFAPAVGILMETEIWPNVLRTAARRGTPVFLVNARMSARSARGYARVSGLTRPTLRLLTAIAAQTEADARRIAELGGRDIEVTGSMKFDVSPPETAVQLAREFRARFGGERPVWIAASTREGEEALVLDALREIDVPGVLLILVPRHPQRFDEVAGLLAERGLTYQRRSRNETIRPTTRVVLGDSMGELFAYYGASDVAFVGGSLLPLGGQNPIEAFAMGTPVIVGPHTFNFLDVTRAACEAGAAVEVGGPAELARQVSRLLARHAERETMKRSGLEFASRHRGATSRIVRLIESRWDRPR
ncbi:MAG: 3-deoxy-D-manno-octulosonic acid transferase [Betaproteobacteria bacterium]|nr:3-deoxy-D-manno-octulosonic acid transferase [Betaproteobacteria bacterium]